MYCLWEQRGSEWGLACCRFVGCAFVFVRNENDVVVICMDWRESLLYWRECLLFVMRWNVEWDYPVWNHFYLLMALCDGVRVIWVAWLLLPWQCLEETQESRYFWSAGVMSSCNEGEEERLFVVTFFLYSNAFFVRYTLVSRGRSECYWVGMTGPSNVMKYGLLKELFWSISPTVVRDVSIGRSRGYSG